MATLDTTIDSRYPEQACSIASALLPNQDSTAGWSRRRRSVSICASAWPMVSAYLAAVVARPWSAGASLSGYDAFRGIVHDNVQLASGQPRLDVHVVLCAAGIAAAIWAAGSTRRPAQGRRRRRAVLVWRSPDRCTWRLRAPALVDLARGRCDWRHRPWARLHLASVDAGEWFGSARHGHRHGDHGVRWWRYDRRTIGQYSHEHVHDLDLVACWKPSSPWPPLLLLHDGRCLPTVSRRRDGGRTAGHRRLPRTP